MLGHVQRGGTPTAFDRVLATRFGLHAIDAADAGDWGTMTALRGTEIELVQLERGDRRAEDRARVPLRGGRGIFRLRGRGALALVAIFAAAVLVAGCGDGGDFASDSDAVGFSIYADPRRSAPGRRAS